MVASRQSILQVRGSVPQARVANLERRARLAGESFGYEDAGSLPRAPGLANLSSFEGVQARMPWLIAAGTAMAGFCALALR